jgi:hypothetical protein
MFSIGYVNLQHKARNAGFPERVNRPTGSWTQDKTVMTAGMAGGHDCS